MFVRFLVALWGLVIAAFDVLNDFFARLLAPYAPVPSGLFVAEVVHLIWERRRARPTWRRHPFPEPLLVFRQYDLEHADGYWDAAARIEAAEMSQALSNAPNSRPLLKRLLAFVTAALQSIASSISTRSDSAAGTMQTDAPTSIDAMISNDTAEADVPMPPVSRLHPPVLRVEYTTASDGRGSYPLHVIHVVPGAHIIN
ncbi:unnamed protein product [Penicillium glandicola]